MSGPHHALDVPASPKAPGGLSVEQTPLFVSLGFDDNEDPAGVDWVVSALSAVGGRCSFYFTADYAKIAGDSWKRAVEAGMEAGLHTQDHAHGGTHDSKEWQKQVTLGLEVLSKLGINPAEVSGFRAPYLEYNDALFGALIETGVSYDCSIEEGYAPEEDGSNLSFPYTLNSGSRGHEECRALGGATRQFDVGSHQGLFELPAYVLLVPDDSLAETYHFAPGLRERIASANVPDFPESGYKITGFDWNLWIAAQLTGEEFLAVLKYNFDQRRAGNRAPFLLGAHSEYYAHCAERQKAITDFLDYVRLFPETRIVSHKDVLDFMKEPRPLDSY